MDTTGLILFTNNGKLINHFQTNVLKTYKVVTRHPINKELLYLFKEGVQLRDGSFVQALNTELLDTNVCEITISTGKYHQIKRMMGYIQNRTEMLERIKIGSLDLREMNLQRGELKKLTKGDIKKHFDYKVEDL